jgi:hypothetical protein
MRVFRESDYRLNIVRDRIKVGHTTGVELVDYKGLVWCASVDNGTLVVRRNGNISIQGNCLVDRKAKTVGLPRRCFAEFRDIWGLPKGWIDKFEFTIDGVLYKHGTGMSGRYAHVQAAERARQSTVIGHTHSSCGVEYLVSSKDCIFGMNVGSGVDREAYAFAYGKDFPRKPVLACGIVTDKGRFCQTFPMKL